MTRVIGEVVAGVGMGEDGEVAAVQSQPLCDVAELVHRDIAANFKYARVWGTAMLSPGAQMKGDYIVHDKDVVEIHA